MEPLLCRIYQTQPTPSQINQTVNPKSKPALQPIRPRQDTRTALNPSKFHHPTAKRSISTQPEWGTLAAPFTRNPYPFINPETRLPGGILSLVDVGHFFWTNEP